MQVQSINNTNTNFGMAVKTTTRAGIIINKKLTTNGAKRLMKIRESALKDSVDVRIRTEFFPIRLNAPDVKSEQLIIDVGDGTKYSYKPIMHSLFIVNAIRKAVNKAHKLSEVKSRNLDSLINELAREYSKQQQDLDE